MKISQLIPSYHICITMITQIHRKKKRETKNYKGMRKKFTEKIKLSLVFVRSKTLSLMCDALKPKGPYTQIPCYDTPKSGSPDDSSSTPKIFMVAFLYIFLTNIQILIIF